MSDTFFFLVYILFLLNSSLGTFASVRCAITDVSM